MVLNMKALRQPIYSIININDLDINFSNDLLSIQYFMRVNDRLLSNKTDLNDDYEEMFDKHFIYWYKHNQIKEGN